MAKNYLCISIPEELQKFTKVIGTIDSGETNCQQLDFGVKLVKDIHGNLTCAAYYSDTGELMKKIYYNGSFVSSIEHYRNNTLYSHEKYEIGKLIKKSIYNQSGTEICAINYQYNRNDKIISIQKVIKNMRYMVEYGYDELKRVNSRRIKVNNEILNEQLYRYDILDRIVKYRDNNQSIDVHKINQNNELVNYTITDRVGNQIVINNLYINSDYIGTEIELNGHKTTIKDKSYVDNIMLKRPFTSVDDLDFTISNLIKIPKFSTEDRLATRREINDNKDISRMIIENKKDAAYQKPIPACSIKDLKL